MEDSINLLKQKIQELEDKLQEYKSALRVMEAITGEIVLTPQSVNFKVELNFPSKSTIKEDVFNLIKEANREISTDEVLRKYMEFKKIENRNLAGKSVYPTLSTLRKEGIIKNRPNPIGNGSVWQISEEGVVKQNEKKEL